MREEYDPLNASFPAHLSIFSHFDFVSLEAETQNIVFRLLKAESEVFDVDILTPMNPISYGGGPRRSPLSEIVITLIFSKEICFPIV